MYASARQVVSFFRARTVVASCSRSDVTMSMSAVSLVGGVLIPVEVGGELGPTDEFNARISKLLDSGVFGSTGEDTVADFLAFNASRLTLDVEALVWLLEFGVFSFGVVFGVFSDVLAKNDMRLFCLSDSFDAWGLGGILTPIPDGGHDT